MKTKAPDSHQRSFSLPNNLLTEDISRKMSSDRRFSKLKIFSQKMLQPTVFSQKTKNVNRQATTGNLFLLL